MKEYKVSIIDVENEKAVKVEIEAASQKSAAIQVMFDYVVENSIHIRELHLDALKGCQYGIVIVSDESNITFLVMNEKVAKRQPSEQAKAASMCDNADEIIKALSSAIEEKKDSEPFENDAKLFDRIKHEQEAQGFSVTKVTNEFGEEGIVCTPTKELRAEWEKKDRECHIETYNMMLKKIEENGGAFPVMLGNTSNASRIISQGNDSEGAFVEMYDGLNIIKVYATGKRDCKFVGPFWNIYGELYKKISAADEFPIIMNDGMEVMEKGNDVKGAFIKVYDRLYIHKFYESGESEKRFVGPNWKG